jgi:DNA polymerase-1
MAVQTTGFNDYAIERRRPDYHLVLTGDRFEQMIRFLESSPVLVFDTETSGLDWFRDSRACGTAFAGIVGGEAHHFYVPFRHQTGEEQLDIERISPAIRRLLSGPQLKVGHNLKFDMHIANREGWKVTGSVYDTMVGAKLHDENRFVALKTRAIEDLGQEGAKVGERRVEMMVAQLAKQQKMGVAEYRSRYGYSQVPIWLLGEYACADVDFTRGLWEFYEAPQRAISQRFARIWATEMELLGVLCDAEETGIAIDVEYLVQLRQGLRDYLAQTEFKIRLLLGGRELELGSDAAVRRFLLEELRCPLYKLTRGGKRGEKQYAVDKEVLAEFAHFHPAVPRILAWREAEKLANTYTGSILDRIDSRNYLHPSFQQVGTTSGRLSCTSPNFHNQPVDDDDRAKKHSGKSLEDGGVDPWSIRRAYIVGKPGWVRLFFDYSQIELRVLAYYTKDPILVDAYMNGEDIHTRTSREVFGTEEKAMRRLAKVINFGLSYGLSPKGFSRQVHVPLEEAEGHFKKFFERYRGIVDFRRAFWAQVRHQKGFFQNIFGRPRRITGLSSADGFKRGQAEREAIASLIQGTAAELTKESLVRIARVFKERSLPAQIVSTVHDEIQIDCDARVLPEVAREVKALMEAFPEFTPIPIKVDGDYSITSWADKKKLPTS